MAARTLLLLGLIISIYGAVVKNRHEKPDGVECTSNVHCSPGHCCVISFERYSYPRCELMRSENDTCRPGGPLVTNGTRYYPDMTEIFIEDAYLMFCPCSLELDCNEGVCQDISKYNHLASQPVDKDD